jgi:hypothetical protein
MAVDEGVTGSGLAVTRIESPDERQAGVFRTRQRSAPTRCERPPRGSPNGSACQLPPSPGRVGRWSAGCARWRPLRACGSPSSSSVTQSIRHGRVNASGPDTCPHSTCPVPSSAGVGTHWAPPMRSNARPPPSPDQSPLSSWTAATPSDGATPRSPRSLPTGSPSAFPSPLAHELEEYAATQWVGALAATLHQLPASSSPCRKRSGATAHGSRKRSCLAGLSL